jgi:hypothetical protein
MQAAVSKIRGKQEKAESLILQLTNILEKFALLYPQRISTLQDNLVIPNSIERHLEEIRQTM